MADEPSQVSEDPPPPAEEDQEPATGPVLACFAHPDDAEISAGGTLRTWVLRGREVHLLVLTNGDRGSDDPSRDRVELAATRKQETQDAADVLGLKSARVLDVHDGDLENTKEIQAEVALSVRQIRPETVLTCDPTAWFFEDRYVNHSDHRTAGAVTLDGVFPGAGNPHFFTEQLVDGLEPWNAKHIWMGWTNEPNRYEDVTGTMEVKLAALAAHRSQVEGDLLGFFEEWLPKEAEEMGEKIGVRHAEAFRVVDLS
ncbi:MAG: PIG-L family deacetylase [Actinomycetota bacterium]|nr:PIG-L family deacetylase [Actinomycetota bacterium]